MGPEEFWELNRGDGDEREQILRRANRMMFIDDLERFPLQPIAVGIDEFIQLFGNPSSEDKDIMTQCFIIFDVSVKLLLDELQAYFKKARIKLI